MSSHSATPQEILEIFERACAKAKARNKDIDYIEEGKIMNYHNITKADMLNGQGLRVVLWVSGCEMNCPHCQNPETHSETSGIPFDAQAEEELFKALAEPYHEGITFSGGHPLMACNRPEVLRLIKRIRKELPIKTIWLYTGYTYEAIQRVPEAKEIVDLVDVLCDGPFIESLKDDKLKWVGSSNQRVIDMPKTLKEGKIVIHD